MPGSQTVNLVWKFPVSLDIIKSCLAIIVNGMTEQEAELREEVALWRNLINEWGHERSETVRRIQDALSHAELKLGLYLVAKARLARPVG